MPPDHDVERLVEEALAGDQHACSTLVEISYPLLHHLAMRIVQDEEDAHDVVQEAFLQAFVHLDALRDRAKFAPWVRAIAENLSKRCIKQRHRALKQEGPVDQVEEPGPTPESRYIREEERRSVAEALFHLPKVDRELLVSFYIQGMSYRELGESLKVTEQVVQGRLQASRDRLKGQLSQMVDDVLEEISPSCPTHTHKRSPATLQPIDIHTDPRYVLSHGRFQIIKAKSEYKAWVLHGPGNLNLFAVPFQLIHLTSPDGLQWVNRGPVLEVQPEPSSSRFDRWGIGGFCVLHDAGTYRMWYTGCMSQFSGQQKIGYAVSEDGLEWQRMEGREQGGAVLDRGSAEEDDGENASSPFVLHDDGIYKMWYAATPRDLDEYNTTRQVHIAYAKSMDGMVWEKKGTVLSPGASGTFDSRWIYPGSVVKDGIYRLWYTADDDLRRIYAIGYATSPDGTTWEKQGKVLGGESLFDHAICPSVVWEKRQLWYQSLEGIRSADWDRLEQ